METFKGLTGAQVKERMENGLVNRRVKSATKSVKDIIKGNLFTYFNLVFAVLTVLLVLVGAWKDMLFLVVIVANTGIGIVQEIHAKRVLDKLTLLNSPKARVIRDGREREVAPELLVQDDVVLFGAGSQIVADAVVMDGTATVNEALLTGEADEITKQKGDELLSGSYVVSGEVAARLTGVGGASYISRLTVQATASKEGEQSEMIQSLDYLIIFMGILIIPIGISLFVQSFFFNDMGLYDSVTGMVAAVIGMIPEGLYLLASVAMAVGTARLAGKQVLVHDMKCIETLARVDVLCVDKTGTITEPAMEVSAYESASGTGETPEEQALLSDIVQAMKPDNATMEALREHFVSGSGRMPERIVGFSSERKFSGAVLQGRYYVLGAAECLLGGGALRERAKAYSGQGFRVLVFGECEGGFRKEVAAVRPIGLVLLTNRIRAGARETFSYFAQNGVDIKVISGDNPLTVSVVAAEAGIAGADRYVDASTLKNKEDYADAVETYTVFGRVTPEQKKELVLALKGKKRTVAMTGDGVNDVLALKCADCSVAMASGSEAASSVSQLVLLDSDFSRMPSVVQEGRRVVNNIGRSAALFIVKNIFSMLLSVFSVLLVWNYPLAPAQVSLISLFTIGIPSFVLALEPNRNPIRGRFLSNVLVKAIPAGVTDFIAVSGLVFFCREFEVNLDCLSTSCTVLIGIVGFMILYRISGAMTPLHIAMMASLIAGLLCCMVFAGEFFSITSISRQTAMLMVIFALITEPCLRYLSIFVERFASSPKFLKG